MRLNRLSRSIRPYYTQITPKFAPIKPQFSSFSVTPDDVVKGDIVASEKSVGIVTFCGMNKFDFVDITGKTHIASPRDLRFSLTPREPISLKQLVQLSSYAKSLVPSLESYLDVLYAFYAPNGRPYAFDFASACDRLLRAKYKTDPEISAANVLAIYFLLTFHDKRFMRLDGSPFATLPTELRGFEGNPLKLMRPTPQIARGSPVNASPVSTIANYYSNDIGFSLETKFDRFLVSVYLPIIPWRSTLAAGSPVAMRAISLAKAPMVDTKLRRKFGLRKDLPVDCLIVSALVNPWNNEIVTRSVELGKCLGKHIAYDFFDKTSLFDRNRWDELRNIQTVFEAHAGLNPSRCDFEQVIVAREPLLSRQARHLASVWASEWAVSQQIDMCFLRKENLKPYDEINDETAVEKEVLSNIPGPHEFLNVPAYAPLGYVFDSSLSAVNQQLLVGHLREDKPYSALHLPKTPAVEVYKRKVLPNKQFADAVWERAQKFKKFSELAKSSIIFIRCTVLDDCEKDGVTQAFAAELHLEVKVKVSAAMKTGDTMVCTKVLEADPKTGHILLS